MPQPARVDEWTGREVSIRDIERQLGELRNAAAADGVPDLRTSVLTHVAWVPREWEEAATDTLAGLAERHPSRAILLLPDPEDDDRLDADVSLQCFPFPGMESHVCSEVIHLRLRGARARAPASIITPLLIPDLPAFLRWRGRPPFGERHFEELVDVVDRLIVDSNERSEERRVGKECRSRWS